MELFEALVGIHSRPRPHQLPHVGGLGLGRVDAPGLLPLGHAPPELVVPVQDRSLGRRAQLAEGGLGGALGRGALAWQQGNVYVLHCSTHRVLAHGVVRVHGAVAGVAGASARGHRPAGGHGGRHVGGRGGGGIACHISW